MLRTQSTYGHTRYIFWTSDMCLWSWFVIFDISTAIASFCLELFHIRNVGKYTYILRSEYIKDNGMLERIKLTGNAKCAMKSKSVHAYICYS